MSLVNTVSGVLKAKAAFKRNSRRSRFEVNKAKRLQNDALQEEESEVDEEEDDGSDRDQRSSHSADAELEKERVLQQISTGALELARSRSGLSDDTSQTGPSSPQKAVADADASDEADDDENA